MNNLSLIEVKAVSKTYRRGRLSVPALLNISFVIEPGEFVILVDPSGAGKTTLLDLLAALDWPDQGKIIVRWKEYSASLIMVRSLIPQVAGRNHFPGL
jgi:ABC-type Fe3+/spermidine/putrescine transport system ATPase subunit